MSASPKTTTVRLSVDAKAKLDQLQARLVVMGEKLTKEELLEHLIDVGLRHPADVMSAPRQPDEAGWQRMLSLIHKGGPRTRAEDIDRDLYGGNA